MTSDTLTLAIGLLERAHFSAASEREARDLVVKALQDSKAAPPPAAVGEVAEDAARALESLAELAAANDWEGGALPEVPSILARLRSLPAAPPAAEAATKETP